MDPRDFYRLAERLVRNNSAAEIRSAISRAYYAAFNVGIEILGGMDAKWRGLDHGEVQRYLSNSGDPNVEEMGSLMGDLHSMRIKADYRMSDATPEGKNTATLWVKQAGFIIQTLEHRCRGANRRQILQALQAYEAKLRSS